MSREWVIWIGGGGYREEVGNMDGVKDTDRGRGGGFVIFFKMGAGGG